MTEVKYQSNGQPVTTDFQELKETLGYKVFKPKLGIIGWALILASKENRNKKWLKHHIDTMFKEVRKKRNNVKKKRIN